MPTGSAQSSRRIFFYGLFMDCSRLREKGLNPRHIEIAQADGFGLRIGDRATLVAAPGETCWGLVATLEQSEIDRLYNDDSVRDYRPENIDVRTQSGQRQAVCVYNLPPQPLSGSNRQYARSLAELAQRLELPAEYIAEIEAWAKLTEN